MNSKLFQQLISDQISNHMHMLDVAMEAHAQWLTEVVINLVFGTEPAPANLRETAHLHCVFGRWYGQMNDVELLAMPEFCTIDTTHQQMHATARGLLQGKQQGQAPTLDEFRDLLALSSELRGSVDLLKRAIKNNVYLTAKLLIKVFQNTHEAVMITDPQARILNINEAFTRVTGYSASEAIGHNTNLLYSGRQDAAFYSQLWETLKQEGEWQGEIWNRRKDGEVYLEWLSISAVYDEEGGVYYYVGIISFIRTEREHEKWLYQQAYTDPLTGLANRMAMNDRLHQAISLARREQQRVSVMFLDLDGFKQINDKFGHQAGDEALCEVADRLRHTLRDSDTVARFGGDEFVIVMSHGPTATIDDIETMAKKVVRAIAEPYHLEGGDHTMSTSMGISLFPEDGSDADKLLHLADQMLYLAKSEGKNRYRFR